MCKAEHKTQPRHTAPWSPPIHKAYQNLQNINATLRKLCPKPKGAKNRYPPHNLAPHEHSEYRKCWTERQKAKKNLKQARENAHTLRKSYIQDKIDMEELKNINVSKHTILVQIRNTEEQREDHEHIRYVLKSSHNKPLTHVLYPTETTWTPTTTQPELENKLLEQKIKHFSQATRTTNGATMSKLFQCPRETHPKHLKTLIPDTPHGLLKYFDRDPNTKEINLKISPEELRTGIKKWKEKTSTSPSKQHLGHYHA